MRTRRALENAARIPCLHSTLVQCGPQGGEVKRIVLQKFTFHPGSMRTVFGFGHKASCTPCLHSTLVQCGPHLRLYGEFDEYRLHSTLVQCGRGSGGFLECAV